MNNFADDPDSYRGDSYRGDSYRGDSYRGDSYRGHRAIKNQKAPICV